MGHVRASESALRVGVVNGSTLVEERLIAGARRVTIGPSAGDTLIAPLGRSVTLFERAAGRYALRFDEGLEGRLAAPGVQAVALSDWRAEPGRSPRGRIALERGARG